MAAASTLIGVLSLHSVKHGESGFGKTFNLVTLTMAVCPSAVVVSGDSGGGAITGDVIVGSTIICMVGLLLPLKVACSVLGILWRKLLLRLLRLRHRLLWLHLISRRCIRSFHKWLHSVRFGLDT